MAEFDVIVKDGIVVDGTQSQRDRPDIGIARGRITRIGTLRSSDAPRVLDASSQIVVAPGFIHLHPNSDAQLFWDPYLTPSGWHGVTSVVIGTCCFGVAPMPPELRQCAMFTTTRVEAVPYESMRRGLPWDWISYPEFLDRAPRDRRPGGQPPPPRRYGGPGGSAAAQRSQPPVCVSRSLSRSSGAVCQIP